MENYDPVLQEHKNQGRDVEVYVTRSGDKDLKPHSMIAIVQCSVCSVKKNNIQSYCLLVALTSKVESFRFFGDFLLSDN
jgi:hypothetical protein